jgi:hypothetical protein
MSYVFRNHEQRLTPPPTGTPVPEVIALLSVSEKKNSTKSSKVAAENNDLRKEILAEM